MWGLLLASVENTEYKAPSGFMSHAINRLPDILPIKVFENIGFPTLGSNPGCPALHVNDLTTRPPSCSFNFIAVLIVSNSQSIVK